MKRPERIEIGPYRFQVTSDHAELRDAESRAGHRLSGQQGSPRCKIIVNPDAAADYQRETMFHEVLHAVWDVVGLDPGIEEDTVKRLSPTLLDTLLRNPQLTDYLLDRGEGEADGETKGS